MIKKIKLWLCKLFKKEVAATPEPVVTIDANADADSKTEPADFSSVADTPEGAWIKQNSAMH